VKAEAVAEDAKVKVDRRVIMVKQCADAKEDLETAQTAYKSAVADHNALVAQQHAVEDSVKVAQAQLNVELPLMYTDTPARERHERARKALLTVGLAGREEHQPSQLSGGQQQRVAIARSLVNDPSIILADEPTGALDSRIGLEIMAIFQRLNREEGITMIVVTHDPDIAAYSNRNIHFKDGKLQLDERLAQPRDARKDLKALPAEQPEEIVSS
jgi:ABC-type lipoprotein export system ATPase subunit